MAHIKYQTCMPSPHVIACFTWSGWVWVGWLVWFACCIFVLVGLLGCLVGFSLALSVLKRDVPG